MYVPRFAAVDDDRARAIVSAAGSGWLVTGTGDGPPAATLMPVLWRGDRLVAHMAKANEHWRSIVDGMPALVIVTGPEAYISPSWYPSKAEHGRVVPTWNYLAVHLTGTVFVHRDPEWLRALVTDLTERHERERAEPWHVTDAPDDHITAQLHAIVGIEMHVEHAEGAAKLSQNRSAADHDGVVAGLEHDAAARASATVADAMTRDVAMSERTTPRSVRSSPASTDGADGTGHRVLPTTEGRRHG